MKLKVLFGIVLSSSLFCPSSGLAQTNDAADGPVLRPGDLIQIRVWRKPELSGDFIIAPDSTIGDPFYQELKVAGLPIAIVEQRVMELVTRYETSPKVLVAPLFRVSVAGEVRQPGLFNVTAGTTILEALALAGGVTENARMSSVTLYRNRARQALDLSGDAIAGFASLRSGDQVVVGRRQTQLFTELIAPVATLLGVAVGVLNLIRR